MTAADPADRGQRQASGSERDLEVRDGGQRHLDGPHRRGCIPRRGGPGGGFMPDRMLAKVWAYFDQAGPLVGGG
jgi:hypothetical protein